MKIKVSVISERVDEFQGKRGPVKQHVLALLDVDTEHRLLNTFDYVMGEEEVEKWSGKLVNKLVEVGIMALETAFGGRLRAKGKLIVAG